MIYFDELKVGDSFEAPGRTVTETDIVMFAGLTGDYNYNHTNVEAAKKKVFGERIAHGLLLLTLTRGLMFRSKVIGTDAELSFLGIPALTFNSPVKIGDTIHVNFTVKELIEDEHQRDRGVVLFQCETLNQNDVSTLTSTFKSLIAKKPKA